MHHLTFCQRFPFRNALKEKSTWLEGSMQNKSFTQALSAALAAPAFINTCPGTFVAVCCYIQFMLLFQKQATTCANRKCMKVISTLLQKRTLIISAGKFLILRSMSAKLLHMVALTWTGEYRPCCSVLLPPWVFGNSLPSLSAPIALSDSSGLVLWSVSRMCSLKTMRSKCTWQYFVEDRGYFVASLLYIELSRWLRGEVDIDWHSSCRAMSVCYNETREFMMNAFFSNYSLSEDLAINAMSNSKCHILTTICQLNSSSQVISPVHWGNSFFHTALENLAVLGILSPFGRNDLKWDVNCVQLLILVSHKLLTAMLEFTQSSPNGLSMLLPGSRALITRCVILFLERVHVYSIYAQDQ